MLRSLRDLEGYKVAGTDGAIGSVKNFLLDDERWIVRYLVVQTGSFFDERPVLITPISFREVDWSTHRIHLSLTVDKIKASPGIDMDPSVSRQHERAYHRYFGYPYYWGYTGVWGMGYFPSQLARRKWDPPPEAHPSDHGPGDAHLRSAHELRGYDVRASDGAIGDVVDFLVDDEDWQVQYLVVDTSRWWHGKKVIVSPHWARRLSWEGKSVYLDLTRQAIEDSPTWDPASTVGRDYEERLFDHYGRPPYWAAAEPPEEVTQPYEGRAG
jgi:sporulation protein YlmC with PRC-barrel domain